MSDQNVTVEVEDPETAEYIGHSLIDDARSLGLIRPEQEELRLEIETLGRNLIEESRKVRNSDEEWVGGSQFEDTLFDVE